MENASKALLMAASVLIGILVISLAVYLFVSFGSTSAEIHKQNAAQQISQFNSQFTSYEEKTCTIYDVVSVASLATENNNYYELYHHTGGRDNYISVQVKMAPKLPTNMEGKSNEEYNEIIQLDLNNYMQTKTDEKGIPYQALAEYTCKVAISPTTERVHQVIFTKK